MTPLLELKRMAYELTNRFNCLLFGSLGLLYTYPEVLDTTPHDADFMTDSNRDNLAAIIRFLQKSDYTVYSWQDPIVEGFDMDVLTGRIYIRGIKYIQGFSPAIIDITYEFINFPFKEMLPLTVVKDSIRILNKDGYIYSLGLCVKQKQLKRREILMNL